ncbi:MAG: AAA family ATPase [gamma proteobacterium symbiont of Ctena orbiculata]|uniref:AAA family ATPase n=1 Tax=Candidatus Thiodiazotropha taylori TaxID=2792791 RepID=A0A944MDV1_9GAMM|nr:AAA family ATPase [Candidatus Thiodiazotropha taylori]PUB90065.1 MAG: AAA family ATPase [gamma proteobacterium symbiont of Ctena orbiculata]MBT2997202.1 AAA family ATPase [Candidatus Thiodiazotropha taylori]MBT3001355.1 AAA family ATPase [Candidatus Thiodiazotropha taylori]MBT3029181.1 AAA family ATPase [Candidatus Thiodiazotropha taylori]
MSAELRRVIDAAGNILLGKQEVVKLSLACLLARGHLLIEDLPGVGKTTLAHTLAQMLGLHYQRIQFTSDLLPSDIVGVSIYERSEQRFQFHHGPIFAQLVLADEINRATPKAQSALLEAMEERQVTTDGVTHGLPEPFFVIATQNPSHQVGTFPLPESQLDRFLMRLRIGYPERAAERDLLSGEDRRQMLKRVGAVIESQRLTEYQQRVSAIHVSDALIDYCQDILAYSRESPDYRHGLSPRAGLAILQSARAWALIEGRKLVLPEDLQAVLPATIGHRLQPAGDSAEPHGESLVMNLISSVPIP